MQPIPKNKREFIAALNRAKARALYQAADSIGGGGGRQFTIVEQQERLRLAARTYEEDATFVESISADAADVDSLLVSHYKSATR